MNFTLGRRLKNFIKIQFFVTPKKRGETAEVQDGDGNGVRRVKYESGALKAEIHMKDGRLDGPANLYYESGNIKAKEFYRDNNLQGLSKWYYESGELQSEKYYTEGKHIYTKEYDKRGNLISESKF